MLWVLRAIFASNLNILDRNLLRPELIRGSLTIPAYYAGKYPSGLSNGKLVGRHIGRLCNRAALAKNTSLPRKCTEITVSRAYRLLTWNPLSMRPNAPKRGQTRPDAANYWQAYPASGNEVLATAGWKIDSSTYNPQSRLHTRVFVIETTVVEFCLEISRFAILLFDPSPLVDSQLVDNRALLIGNQPQAQKVTLFRLDR